MQVAMFDLPGFETMLPAIKEQLDKGVAMVFKFFDLKVNIYNNIPGLLTRLGESCYHDLVAFTESPRMLNFNHARFLLIFHTSSTA